MNNEEKILAILEKHGEMMAQMQTDITDMKGDITDMKGDITSIKARLDYDVEKRFDAVNDGIDTILEQLTPKSRVDALEADVVVLKAAIKTLSTEVSALKKAQ